jgi:hypothetical protein
MRKSENSDQNGYLKVAGLFCSILKCENQAGPYPASKIRGKYLALPVARVTISTVKEAALPR